MTKVAEKGYAAPELLADGDWVMEHSQDPNVRIVEMGTKPEDFEQGHVPGAIRCADWRIKSAADPALVATPAEARALMESLGIGDDTTVIAYDRNINRDATRLWWVLTYYGHANVKVLDGGWKRWTLDQRPVETGPGADVGKAAPTFTPEPNESIRSTVETMKAAIGDAETVIWDIRSREEYIGENDRGNKRAGHVPGALHLDMASTVNEQDHTFKTGDEIRELARGLGITPDTVVHVY